jgi:hypothetical protein
MSPKKELTLIERARKLSEAERLQYLSARTLFEELSEIKEAAELYIEQDPAAAVESLTEAVEPLSNLYSLGTFGAKNDQLEESVVELTSALASQDDLQTLVDAIEMLEESLDEVETHRDSPGDYDADEKSQARDQVRENLDTVADALDTLAS